ncbi:MAG: GNAT family N-acetyltransferase [Bacteroidota bacterium]
MKFEVKPANEDVLKQKAFSIRKEVFVIEQKVAEEEEFDEYEEAAHHFVALDEEELPLGASRWRVTGKGVKLERFAVRQDARGKGVGSVLLKTTLEDIDVHLPKGTYLYLHAQLGAVSLYEKFGFTKKGAQFDECGIQHYMMWKTS